VGFSAANAKLWMQGKQPFARAELTGHNHPNRA
jgi:hypothetical protein